jgi:hypothetical protein
VLALAAILLALVVAPSARAQASDAETQLAGLIDRARAAAGLAGLRVSPELMTIARRHAAEMAAAGQIYHQSLDPIDGRHVAENVGVGQSVDLVHDAFMRSSVHRANILGSDTELGVGVVVGRDGIYVDEVFRTPWSDAAGATAPVAPEQPAATTAPAAVEAPSTTAATVAPEPDPPATTAPTPRTTPPPPLEPDAARALVALGATPAAAYAVNAAGGAVARAVVAPAVRALDALPADGDATGPAAVVAGAMIVLVLFGHARSLRSRPG